MNYSLFAMVFLVPGVQQDDSDIDRGILFHILFHYSLLQDTEYSSLCCTTWLFIYFLCFFLIILFIYFGLCWVLVAVPFSGCGERGLLSGCSAQASHCDVMASFLPKSQLIGKDLDAGKHWGQEEKGVTENETVGWHHPSCRHESKQAPGDGEEQESLACSSPWGLKMSDRTVQLDNNKWC